MSSLMQFRGEYTPRGIGLQFVKAFVPRKQCGRICQPTPEETIIDPATSKACPKIYVAYRKPKGMLGNWVVFRYNRKDHLPDLSCPTTVEKLPRDAKYVGDAESIRIWTS